VLRPLWPTKSRAVVRDKLQRLKSALEDASRLLRDPDVAVFAPALVGTHSNPQRKAHVTPERLTWMAEDIEFVESDASFRARKSAAGEARRLDEEMNVDLSDRTPIEREGHGILVDHVKGDAGRSSLYDVLGGANGEQVVATGVSRLWALQRGHPPGKSNTEAAQACDLIWDSSGASWERQLLKARESHMHAWMIVNKVFREAGGETFFPDHPDAQQSLSVPDQDEIGRTKVRLRPRR
jgi:hypothetical protein